MKKRKSFGIRIIGKTFQFDGDKYSVIKTKMGFYPRVKGKNIFMIGKRYSTAHDARGELMRIYQTAKSAKKEYEKKAKYEIYFRKKGNKRWLRSGKVYTSLAKADADRRWLDRDKRSHYEHCIRRYKGK